MDLFKKKSRMLQVWRVMTLAIEELADRADGDLVALSKVYGADRALPTTEEIEFLSGLTPSQFIEVARTLEGK